MNLLIINTVGMGYEGISTTIIQLFSQMNKEDMNIDLVSVREMEPPIRRKINDIGIQIINIEYRKTNTIRYLFQLFSHMNAKRYDVVHIHGNSATMAIELLAATLAGCKIRIVHSRNTSCDYSKTDKLLRPLFNFLYTDGFACGEDAGKWLFKDQPFTIIKNGKNLDLLSFNAQTRAQIRSEKKWDDKILLGHVGHFTYQKNHEFIIKTFKELKKINPAYHLCLVGDGELRADVEKLVVQYNLSESVDFLGQISNVHEILCAMDLMILPSRFEGLPNVVIEWQASGLPCLLADNITSECAITELVDFYPLSKGPEKWAKKIIGMPIVDRKSQKQQLKKNIKTAGFDLSENAAQLKNKYFELLKKI